MNPGVAGSRRGMGEESLNKSVREKSSLWQRAGANMLKVEIRRVEQKNEESKS